MINLETFFRNHFDTSEISDANLNKFTEIHLQRLAAANDTGSYTAMLTATTTAYNAYFGAISNEDVAFAVQQSLTKSKDSLFEEFKKTVSQKEGTIRGIWGKESPEYQEFFPLGLNEYTKASLANVEMLMERMVTASTTHKTDLGQAFVQLFTDLRDNFIAARSSQLEKIGEVKEDKSATAGSRDELETQVMNNLLLIAGQNIGKPERLTIFFDQSFIRSQGSSEEEEGEEG